MKQITCSECQKVFERESFCSGACRVRFNNKRRKVKKEILPVIQVDPKKIIKPLKEIKKIVKTRGYTPVHFCTKHKVNNISCGCP
jgi:hypothetical protein